MSRRMKILMYKKHIAYLDGDLLQAFEHHCKVVNFSAWIREQAHLDFGIRITGADDLEWLDEAVQDNFYTDKTEWLREKMRDAVREEVR